MSIYTEIASLILSYVCLLFLFAQLLKDNSIIDIAWGLGFALVACWIFFKYPTSSSYKLLVFVTITWGLRLSIYLFLRWWTKKKEDWRYQNWRKQWGKYHRIRAFLQVFLLQGFFMWMISLPLMQVEFERNHSLQTIQYIGLFLWTIGFLWEAIADWQLFQFKKESNNKGKLIQIGLWQLSRHPNYFGEILVWWGIFFIALPFGNWGLSILSPLLITGVLVFISQPMLERKMKKRPAFDDYKKNTPSIFFPKIF